MHLPTSLTDMWEVLTFFIIPVGGGIPAGVVLANKKGIAWPMMLALYFVSDVLLAIVFEPLMLMLIRVFKHSRRMQTFVQAYKMQMEKSVARYGVNPGPFTLVLISFGIDPMTGRTAAHAAGHGFVTGWLIAIAGDMVFFSILMVSTLWLNNVLGDGTWTAIIVMAAMFLVPYLIRRAREKYHSLRSK
jgi:hypothetical protein